ncbi:Nif-specific regulatory protein [Novosphingobium sp. SG751A]|uniref:nif-specific transcriptional activator NifA n=1 Tax=Novosphingobium sp. SG751A TaxID=2587000 RepID=UPI00273A53DD|nr:nif-specific transcriptional activator NifA [Novosphingobium sp. SG751A]NOW48470.1 Nif-specific regulatory protein [Novosphingobium sp. SG751A]
MPMSAGSDTVRSDDANVAFAPALTLPMPKHNMPKRSQSHTRADIALRGIYEISKILATPARLETTLANVMTLLSSFMDMRHGIVALIDEKGDPRSVVGIGWSEQQAHRYFERLPERAVGQVVTTQMPVVIHNIDKSALFAGWERSEKVARDARVSFIGVPIKDGDKVIGTLTIEQVWDDDTTYHAADEDVRFLTMVANLIGQTVRLMDLIGRDRERLMDQQRLLEKELSRQEGGEKRGEARGIVGSSPALGHALNQIRVVARSHSAVLLRGESGTGKELFARATHDFSPRAKKPFIKLNCAALPESVLESELFGHEKGAFTGAVTQRKGRFELADGGTLFLDEIGDTSLSFQVKLLRVLQEGEFERVGGMNTIKVDVRLVCATNRNLEEMVARGEFRADLYYRINVVSVRLPALRDRREDIPLLALEFLRRFDDEHRTRHELSPSAIRVLDNCYFPGNVRELENCIRRTATLAPGDRICEDDFACRHDECLSATLWKTAVSQPFSIIQPRPKAPIGIASPPIPTAPSDFAGAPFDAEDGGQDNVKITRNELVAALEATGWVQAKAARMLHLTPRQIGYALRKYGVEVKRL